MTTLSKIPRLKLGLEMISFQRDNTGALLEEQITFLVSKIKDKTLKDDEEVFDSEEMKTLVDILYRRFGMKFDIQVDSMYAAILPFYSNRHHIFLNKEHIGVNEREAIRILKSGRELKGTVNTETVRVTGVFSEYPNYLFMNFRDLIKTDLTTAEITAVMLHEVGHGFYACEYADRFESANQILAAVFAEMTERKDKKDMAYVYRELKKLNPELTEKETELLVSDDKIIAGYYWFKFMVGAVESQMPVRKYDETSFEAMADNFVSRFGYGRHLVTGLDKIHRAHFSHPNSAIQKLFYWTQVLNLYLAFSGLAVILANFGVIASTVPWVLVNFGIYLFSIGTAVWMSGDDKKDMTYDDLRDRYKRVRNDAVADLKNYKLPEEYVDMMVSNIKAMDKIIDTTNTTKNAFNQFSWLLFPANRRADGSIKEQRMLEDLIANDLFVKSAELRTA